MIEERRMKSAGAPFWIAANTMIGGSGVIKPLMYAFPVSGVYVIVGLLENATEPPKLAVLVPLGWKVPPTEAPWDSV
jgi:hypothetical protein